MRTISTYISEKLRISSTIPQYSCRPNTSHELRSIVKDRIGNDRDDDMNDIDISLIDNLSSMFFNLDPYNIDISQWDVSNVTDISWMFCGCKNFNCNLSDWDVSKVCNMAFMFAKCFKFNCDLSRWNVKNVKTMNYMFNACNSMRKLPYWYKK